MDNVYETKQICFQGVDFRVRLVFDYDYDAPWRADPDVHGVVNEYEQREPEEHERILHSEGFDHLFYDMKASREKAIKVWGVKEADADKAVEDNFNYLYGYCNNDWCYIAVIVDRKCPHCDEYEGRTLVARCGIESNNEAFIDIEINEALEEGYGLVYNQEKKRREKRGEVDPHANTLFVNLESLVTQREQLVENLVRIREKQIGSDTDGVLNGQLAAMDRKVAEARQAIAKHYAEKVPSGIRVGFEE